MIWNPDHLFRCKRTLLILTAAGLSCAAPARSAEPPAPGAGDRSGGVGLALDVKSGVISVAKVMPNSPAAANKHILEGYRILAVGEGEQPAQSLVGKSIEEAVSMVRGEVGSQVRLTVAPADAPATTTREVMLTRDDLTNPLGLALDAPLLEPGAPAPDLRYIRLSDRKTATLAEHRGKIVVLQFWAPWSEPCQQSVTALQKAAANLTAKSAKVIFLSVSIGGDAAAANQPVLDTVDAHVKQKGWAQTTHGWSSLQDRSNWHIGVLPTTYIIGADGKIVAVDPEKLEDQLPKLLTD